ncbi:NADH:ubiquinone oxidoreductase intermediate-associated protein 30 isoform X3 [Carex rostrata]
MSRFRSLWQTSIQATKRALKGTWEDLMPPSEKVVFHFNSKDEISRWHLYADSELGGLSSASLEIPDTDSGAPLTGVFSGNLSLDLDECSTWRMKRSGFCGMRSKRFNGFIDLDSYDTIAMRLCGDGRCYISTIYTENWVNSPGQQEDNSWQAFVYVPKDTWHITKGW